MGRIRAKRRGALGGRGDEGAGTNEIVGTRPARLWLGRSGLVGFGIAIGLSVGSVGWSEAPPRGEGTAVSIEPARIATSLPPSDSDAAARQKSQSDRASLLAEWMEMAEVERLKSLAQKATGAGLDLVARGVIDRLEDDSLKSMIASTTDFSSAELGEIDDIRGFAMDLARIAMEGTVREASEPAEDVLPIDFSSEITWDHRASFAQRQFASDEPRIYAVFESDDLGVANTLAKWTRVDNGEILLFKRHRIRAAAESSYVFLDAPPEGFAPGEYRVDFYSADTELRWLASGQHRVTI